MSRILFLFAVLLTSIVAQAELTFESEAWKKSRASNKEITIYTQVIEEQPIKAVKAEMELNTTLENLLMVLTDTEQIVEWVPILSEAKLLQKPNKDGVSYIYMATKLPWPVRDRDVVVRTVARYNESSEIVTMDSVQASDYMKPNPNFIRSPSSVIKWKVQKLKKNKVKVGLVSHSDPGGRFPKFVANLLVTQTPKLIKRKLEKTLEKRESVSSEFDSLLVFGRDIRL